MWIVGGTIGSCWSWSNDVWYSADGILWSEAPPGVFNPYESFIPLVFNNRIWIFRDMEIWRSADGVRWARMRTPAEHPELQKGQNKLVYDNKMWIISGYNRGRADDVWSSSDGITWVRVGADQMLPSDHIQKHKPAENFFAGDIWANQREWSSSLSGLAWRPSDTSRSCW
jgi:hypothetical protein